MVAESRRLADIPIGEIAYPTPEIMACPYPFYERLRTEAPVFQWPGHPGEYFVTRWEDLAYITAHPEIFANGAPPGGAGAGDDYPEAPGDHAATSDGFDYTPTSVSGSNPPEHRMKRNFLAPLVSRESLARYEPRLREICNDLIDAFVNDGECEFVSQFASPLPILLIFEVLGFPREDAPMLWEWTQAIGLSAPLLPPEKQAELRAGQEYLHEYVQQAILARYERPTDDFTSELIKAQLERDGGRLNLPYLTNEAALLIHASNHTTAFMMANTMMLLVQHPETMQRVRADHSLIPAMVEEALRLEAPTHWTRRWVRQDTTIGDVEVPAGAQLLMVWAAGNRDPAKFECPEEFRIDRPQLVKHQMAFGRGMHLCLGAPLGRQEGRVAFEVILDRLVNIRAAPGKNDFAPVDIPNKRAPKVVYIEFDRA